MHKKIIIILIIISTLTFNGCSNTGKITVEAQSNLDQSTEFNSAEVESGSEADIKLDIENIEASQAELIHNTEDIKHIEETDNALIGLEKEIETKVETPVENKVEAPVATQDTKHYILYNFDKTEAPGINVYNNEFGIVDYSHSDDGYVMVKYTEQTDKKLKARVIGPAKTYTYNIPFNEWQSLVLSDGNGEYKIALYENVIDTKYATKLVTTINVQLKNEFAPFIHSNQYVNFENSVNIQQKAAELVYGETDTIKKVENIYNYVVNTLEYDKELAKTVQSGYLPDLDKVLERKSGICFDYAALMTGMLRSQGIPCKLVVGYVGEAYHAWIDVWSDHDGWINKIIVFHANTWERMDPTFASSGGQSEEIVKYIGNGKNYTVKYYY